jgi:pyridoxamine 5'-phosphate oxidase
VSKFVPFSEPFEMFDDWLSQAEKNEPNDYNAVAVATTTADGHPSVRMVLLKAHSEEGFVFYTNFESRKGRELLGNLNAAMLFHWKSLRRQIRIEGRVEVVTEEEADEYFASRPRVSQIGSWASAQSRMLEGRFEFEALIAKYTAKFGVGDIPRPPHWSGFRVIPDSFEFWEDRKFRLHDRQQYNREKKKAGWIKQTLFP